ncbi:MAG: AAA family ATPase, partial [Brevibacterium aurantiacum]|nr:AAA family ATPase [Brevibacterium aurantiacum]
STTDDAVSAAVACPSDVDERLENQVKEVARLRTSDPTQEKRQLNATVAALETISQYLAELDKALGADGQKRLDELSERVMTTQRAAELASRNTFADEPLSGVGSSVWQVLWRAAEGYSKEVYPEHVFPHTEDGAVCVLCQQTLSDGASDRLTRFHRFVTDTTTREAEAAQRALDRFRDDLEQLEITPRAVSSAIATVQQREESFTESLDTLLEKIRARKETMVAGEQTAPVDVSTYLTRLKAAAARHRNQAADVNAEGFAEQLAEAQSEEQRLRDQIAMRDGRNLIEAERTRIQKVAALNSKFSVANTRSITDKAGELTRRYITEEARERFARETDWLGLERVTFNATKARQGALLHKADFLNARPGARLVEVLSEGEQTALGFAGFLTEAHFDESRSALVFDDPVSSLDHMKRESVARRIVALAEERQVVVFTHDVAFTMMLRKAAGLHRYFSNPTKPRRTLISRVIKGSKALGPRTGARRMADCRGPMRKNSSQSQTRLSASNHRKLLVGYSEGVPVQALAERFKIHRSTVRAIARRAGYASRIPEHSEELRAEAARLYAGGLTLAQVAHQLGIGDEGVRSAVIAAGGSIRPKGRRRIHA